jgi:hypothetical protein
MYDATDWRASRKRSLEAETGGDHSADFGRSPAGWWILPSVVLGTFGWIGLFSLLF